MSESEARGFIRIVESGLSRITQMTRIIGGVMVVGGRELSEAGLAGFMGLSGLKASGIGVPSYR